jgi:hypothetical protein
MPGSWERSRLTRDRRSRTARTLPSQRSGGFFVFRSAACSKCSGESRKRETRIPGLARKRACSQARGLTGGNEAKARHRWQGEPNKGSLRRRAIVESAATDLFFRFRLHIRGHRIPGGDDPRYFVGTEGPRAVEDHPFPRNAIAACRGSTNAGGEEAGCFASRPDQMRSCKRSRSLPVSPVPWRVIPTMGVTTQSATHPKFAFRKFRPLDKREVFNLCRW